MTIYLYVKTHQKTGLKYLGITTRSDPHKYRGSGDIWKKHIKKHGYHVDTIILRECSSKEEVKKWGIYYSELWDVVKSTEWANLTPEEGTGGKTREISANKGKITVVDRDGCTLQTDVDDPLVKTGILVSVNKRTIGVTDENGNRFRTSVDDPKYLSGEYKTYTKGKVPVIDEHGNTMMVSTNDPKYLSGKYSHILKGKITVVDNDGNTLKVSVNDPRYISGELISIHTRMVSVKDNTGKSFWVSVDDPRYISGELKFFGGPRKGYKQKIVTCPHCGNTGGISNMSRSHFDNCKSNK